MQCPLVLCCACIRDAQAYQWMLPAGRHLPEPRRAHAGAMMSHPDEDGTQLWLIHGGKRRAGSVMGDLWQATVRWPDVSWELLDRGPEGDGEEGGQGDRRRSHAPAARRGHAAVMVPGSPSRLVRCAAGPCTAVVLLAAAALMYQQHAAAMLQPSW